MSSGTDAPDNLSILDEHEIGSDALIKHTVHVCPGCYEWQVEMIVPRSLPPGTTARTSMLGLGMMVDILEKRDGAEQLATEHRAICSAFDMLAGLGGVPG